ncbi:hypothetical protein F441_09433 [Phytophthora nicotianae CJ01A1]|uniref:Uncharacterized protein n=4 Tax=Phytophthora nicotianae TaxID=4792 RepID=V9F6U8_PHYNI|nr:hypothetical protein F443_09488 [Phytophthora nicotianae P1569]ETO74782.1 hypothetical protein F444_09556 [Phytophthora nicotianae P1976]ETP15917.1 hypothetical protein F441_09433 [Phytophthora nicotianae CJ01A1]ETP43966.1 hypothetical protein F442_09402 [Phytophthora nicotianae P10297]
MCCTYPDVVAASTAWCCGAARERTLAADVDQMSKESFELLLPSPARAWWRLASATIRTGRPSIRRTRGLFLLAPALTPPRVVVLSDP